MGTVSENIFDLHPRNMNRDDFEKAVARAIEEIPDEFRSKMENVQVVVEDFPDSYTLRSIGAHSKWELLGFYEGVPVDRRSFFDIPGLPARITLFRRPIIRAAASPWAVVRTIREVLLHELGHHLGFEEDALEELEGRSE
ncbi:MAG: metallopeptidase family protein [Thermodesulfobacteriota bacterium]